jgi:hypothetical protein
MSSNVQLDVLVKLFEEKLRLKIDDLEKKFNVEATDITTLEGHMDFILSKIIT